MALTKNKKTSLTGYLWLFMAVFCIVFSSASKWLIEQKVNPAYYYSPVATFNKKIRDNSRDKREYMYKITQAEKQQPADNELSAEFLIPSLFSLAQLCLPAGEYLTIKLTEQHCAMAGARLL